MALADIGYHGSHAAAVAARLGRQEALHNPDRSFEFLPTEAALRYRPAPPQALTAQPGGRRDAITNQTLTAQLDLWGFKTGRRWLSCGFARGEGEFAGRIAGLWPSGCCL
jgi:hypothetical protein